MQDRDAGDSWYQFTLPVAFRRRGRKVQPVELFWSRAASAGSMRRACVDGPIVVGANRNAPQVATASDRGELRHSIVKCGQFLFGERSYAFLRIARLKRRPGQR